MTRHLFSLLIAAMVSLILASSPAARANSIEVDVTAPIVKAAEKDDDAQAQVAESANGQKENDEEKAENEAAEPESKDASEEKEEEAAAATEEEAADKKVEDKEKDDEKKKADDAKKRKTHTVAPKRLKIDIGIDGTFVAREMEEVVLRPETWTGYEIVEIVDHGQKVREGQTLVRFDDRRINEAIADLELDQRLNELSIRRDEEELPRMERTLALSLRQAERADQESQEDFERYHEIERPMMVKSANFLVRYYESMLEYQQEELDQLQKMYEADDLTEETEEIILKRQRNSVEFAKFNLESANLGRDNTLNVRLPRMDTQIKESLERTQLSLARARMASSLDVNRARYELEQKRQARTKSLDRHAKLLGDRDLMEIKSPADGIVYYGQCVNGRWPDTTAQIAKLRPKSNVAPGSVILTVVNPRPVYVTATFDEKHRPNLADGQKARISPPAEGSDHILGRVESISPVPVSTGKFEITLKFDQDQVPDWIAAGMSCKATIHTYDKKDALTVPKAAVHTDEDDANQHYVWVVEADDVEAKPERRDVKLGRRSGDDIEILEGIKKGDVVSLEDEANKKKEAEAKDKDEA